MQGHKFHWNPLWVLWPDLKGWPYEDNMCLPMYVLAVQLFVSGLVESAVQAPWLDCEIDVIM